MRRLVSLGSRRFEIAVLPHDRPAARALGSAAERTLDRAAAIEVLRRLALAPENRVALRGVLAEVLPGTASPLLTDAVATERVASLLRAGALALVELPAFGTLVSVDGAAEEAPAPASERPPPRPVEPVLTWIEVQLIGEDDGPIPGERYRIEAPDGSIHEGRLDSKGLARVDGLDPGSCKVTFPDLDEEACKRV